MKNGHSNKKVFVLAILLIIVGLGFVSWDYLLSKRQKVYDEISFVLSDLPDIIESDEIPMDEDSVIVQENPSSSNEKYEFSYNSETTSDFSLSKNYYIGKLVIPKIDLAKGFAAQGTRQNNVDKNIAIVSPSDYPDVTNGNFILTGHAGHAWNTFFRDLRKLSIGDEAIVYYKNKKYTYKLVNKYDEPRGSKLKIYRNINKTTMTLITCSMTNNKAQTIFIFER